MNRSFLELYQEELIHIRERASEFAIDHSKIAARLALSKDASECPDPFVERLLEGFAFLSARTQLKLEAEFPRFTQGILETVYPDYLAPLPSAAIVCFETNPGDKSLMGGLPVPRRTPLQAPRPAEQSTACTYTTAHDITLYPLEVSEARYHLQDIEDFRFGDRYKKVKIRRDGESEEISMKAALRIRLSLQGSPDASLAKLECNKLCFYLHERDDLPAALLEEIFAHGMGVAVMEAGDVTHRRSEFLPMSAVRHAGFGEDEALLPKSPQTFSGHRLLREYFIMPQRFLFLEVSGLQRALSRFSGRSFDLIIPLCRQHTVMASSIRPSMFRLNCTPVVNIFEKTADSADIRQGMSECQVVVSKVRTSDYEVYRVLEAAGYGQTGSLRRQFQPFYLQEERGMGAAAYYSVCRRPRVLSEKEKKEERKYGERNTYHGSEVFLSLCDPQAAPFSPDLEHLRTRCLCTNRHLPLLLTHGSADIRFTSDVPVPVKSIYALVRPTPPRPSPVDGRYAWRAVNHLSLNYLSLVNRGPDGAAALRELLRLYASNPQIERQVEGLVSVRSVPHVARPPGNGPVCFVRGVKVEATFDEHHYAGTGTFLFASVIEQFLAGYVTLNGFTEMTLKTEQRGRILTWPARMGRINPL